MTQTTQLRDKARYTFGGDEFLFVEIDEAMSLAANIRAMGIAKGLQSKAVEGIVEICPANASLLIRFNPDILAPSDLRQIVESLEEETKNTENLTFESRVVEVPVWYQDKYTSEVVERFREGYHQEPDLTDLEYAAKINGESSVEDFIRRHHENPWLVTMVGFVAGLPFMYQLVEGERQIEVPKYLSPRPSSTPKLTVGHGGCFACIYSVEGAGGYQMFGVAAGPIFDPSQSLPNMKDSMVFFRPGDIVKFKPVSEEEYMHLQQEVEAGTFEYRTYPVQFDTSKALADRERYNRELLEVLHGH